MRIVEIVESVETSRNNLEEGWLDKGIGAGVSWLSKSVPFLKGAAKSGADVAADVLKKGAVKTAKVGAVGGTAYLGGSWAIDQLVQWGKEMLENLGLDPETLKKIAEYAKNYAIPLAAAVAIIYGGKKVYDWLSSSDDEKQQQVSEMTGYFVERGAATRALCLSKRSDASLGASALASCKSQGLRPRDGKKSHKLGKKRVQVGGRKIKGRAHGGPLPDWS